MDRSLTALDAKRGRSAGREVSHILTEYSGPSFSDLPNTIMENIILRSSIKGIFICKCVCKTWCHLISDPMFAKLHFDRAEIYPLIRSSGPTFLSRMLYLVKPEQEDFEHKLDICDHICEQDYGCFGRVMVKLDTKLKLPLCNLQKILNDRNGDHRMLNSESGAERNNCMKLKMKDHKYRVVNSCNGLLCLSNEFDNNPLIVCNPITGEFIYLPENEIVKKSRSNPINCGFGFCPVSNQYKVIRKFFLETRDGNGLVPGFVAQVHTLGTKSWKDFDSCIGACYMLFPTSLNGCIHWLSEYGLVSFDMETERFGLVSLAPPLENNFPRDNLAMGVLGKKICITEVYDQHINSWVLNSAEKSLSKLFSIRIRNDSEMRFKGTYQPIKFLNNGAILMFHSRSNALLYVDRNKDGYKYMKVRGIDSKLEAIPHIPSIASLKHVLSGHDVEVLNVNSRCGELRLHKEDKTVSLVEEKASVILNFV